MHPEQIKASIRMKGTTPSALADSMCRSRMLISNVIHGKVVSRPVADRIAKLLGSRADQIWPGKYKPLPAATRDGIERRLVDRRGVATSPRKRGQA